MANKYQNKHRINYEVCRTNLYHTNNKLKKSQLFSTILFIINIALIITIIVMGS